MDRVQCKRYASWHITDEKCSISFAGIHSFLFVFFRLERRRIRMESEGTVNLAFCEY